MEIGKPPIIDGAPGANPAPDVQNATVRQGVMPPPLADRTDIRPLTVPAALQILLAGMFDAWTLPLPAMMPDNPVGVAMLIVHTFLQAVPTAEADPQVFSAVHDQLVANLRAGRRSGSCCCRCLARCAARCSRCSSRDPRDGVCRVRRGCPESDAGTLSLAPGMAHVRAAHRTAAPAPGASSPAGP